MLESRSIIELKSVSQAISLFYSLLALSIMHLILILREEKRTRFADDTGG